ncbi:MAG: ABC transporter permease [Candidatus Cloacimonetes bacterium]|nr:ABC transporter permease [Candidatus Cloacimonadota bacterium]
MALSFKESLFVGLSDFWSRKIRAIITIFSIVLGTMSIIVVQSLVKGVQESTLAWMMERGGLTRIDVIRNWEYNNPRNLPTYLTLREFNQLRSLIPEAEYVTPHLFTWGLITFEKDFYRGSVSGVIPEYPKIEEWNVSEGRFISNIDINYMNDVIVLGSTVKEQLFGNRQAIGQYLTYQGRRLQVIGVMERRYFQPQTSVGTDNFLEYLNRRAFVPISTMINKLSADDRIENITIKAYNVDDTIELKEKVETILLGLRSNEPVFFVSSAKEGADMMAGGSAIFSMIFFVISLISLLVGGIVIMNIMMATVRERTREIGIRMAVGARRIDIFMQFIIQTLIITTSGGVIGILIGLSILDIIGGYLGVQMTGGTSMVILSLIITAILGLTFGIFPAIKASNLDPVKCLSYE